MLNLKQELNAGQLEAVRHTSGPLLVLAGAGSGKTRVITYKIAHLVLDCDYKPWQILAVTFTNKAAGEMRERTEKILGGEAREVWLGTFHSVCLRVLRRHAELVGRTNRFVVYDEDDRERLIKRVLSNLNVNKEVLTGRQVRYYVDAQKHLLRGPNHPELPVEGYIDSLCGKAYKAYEAAKKRADAFDFSDLIFKAVKLMEGHPPVLSEYQYRWRYILVDEFQDTDHAQYRLLKLLAGDRCNISVVGDDDQSIYRWRGADVANILGFPRDFPGREVGVVRLEQNYRSTGVILEAASALIKNNEHRHDKTLWTSEPSGAPLKCYQAETEVGEARWVVRNALALRRDAEVPLNEITVFYRTHSQSRVFEDALRGTATPYIVVGGLKFYERKEVKDILAYLRVVQNPRDDIALQRIINTPTRGVGAKTLGRAQKLAAEREVPLFDALQLHVRGAEGRRARRPVEDFAQIIGRLRTIADNERDAFRVAEAVLAETGYLKRLQEDGSLEAETRAENLQELMVSIQQWRVNAEDPSLETFLDHVSLLTSLDEADADREAVTLMTVHAAKGLEFDTVFVTGLEEDVFPHFNSKEPEAIEEERRLAYVAITRGKRRVFLSWARSRQRFGRTDMNPPSRFLGEIPETIKTYESELGRVRPSTFGSVQGRRAQGAGGSAAWTTSPGRPGGDRAAGGSRGGWAGRKAAAGPSQERQDRHGRTLDYSDSQLPPDELGGAGLIGRRVNHPRFGDGKVARVDGSGPDARVTVQFRGFGAKKIIARFLDLVE